MPKYKTLSLDEIIQQLRGMPEGAMVNGFRDGIIHSDRGFYDRNATAPHWANEIPAEGLADILDDEIGGMMYGWKGGEYEISGRQPLYLAEYGSVGPSVIGFAADPVSGVYEPVLLEETWF